MSWFMGSGPLPHGLLTADAGRDVREVSGVGVDQGTHLGVVSVAKTVWASRSFAVRLLKETGSPRLNWAMSCLRLSQVPWRRPFSHARSPTIFWLPTTPVAAFVLIRPVEFTVGTGTAYELVGDRGRQVVAAGRDAAGVEDLPAAGRPDIHIASSIARLERRERDLGDVAGRDRDGRLSARSRLPDPVGLRDLDVIGARTKVAARSVAGRRRERRSTRGRSTQEIRGDQSLELAAGSPAWNCEKVVPEGAMVGEV